MRKPVPPLALLIAAMLWSAAVSASQYVWLHPFEPGVAPSLLRLEDLRCIILASCDRRVNLNSRSSYAQPEPDPLDGELLEDGLPCITDTTLDHGGDKMHKK